MISPTIGRIVWYWANGLGPPKDLYHPEAADVVFVHDDHTVNLLVKGHSGTVRGESSIYLYQANKGEIRPLGAHCEWMPYQKGQAAKTEVAEQTALELGAAIRAAGLQGP